ncbi:MAG TPA: cytochrome c [Azospirillum sp.]|nr:cytochrome c [Azospirillum sp.]
MSEEDDRGGRRTPSPSRLSAAAVAFALLAALPAGAAVTFLDPLNDQALLVPIPEGDKRTPAVERFHDAGENTYIGDKAALRDGKKVWDEHCQACHLPDGSGRIGPSMLDEQWNHPRNNTDIGMFETLWAGGAGAMQPFRDRLSQDQMLRVIAYIHELRNQKKP